MFIILFISNLMFAQLKPEFQQPLQPTFQPPAVNKFTMPNHAIPKNPNHVFPFFRGNYFWNNIFNYSMFRFPAETEFEVTGDYDSYLNDNFYEVNIRSTPNYKSRNRYEFENYFLQGSEISGLTSNTNGTYKLTKETTFYQRQEIQNRELEDELCINCENITTKVQKDSNLVDTVRLEIIKKKVLDNKHIKNSKKAFLNAWNFFMRNQSKVRNQNYLTVVDYNLPSNKPRLFLINLKDGSVESHMVSHGEKSSGKGHLRKYATEYSNTNGTNKSSHGGYLTGETYNGRFGYSLRIDGQQSGKNSNARGRNIVIHPFDYVTSTNAGDTKGCFGLNRRKSDEIINKTKNGSVWYVEPYSK